MAKRYEYPAIFTFEDQQILVSFPDFEGCVTYGENILEAYKHAKEALEGYIYYLDEDHDEIPNPTDLFHIKVNTNQACVFIDI